MANEQNQMQLQVGVGYKAILKIAMPIAAAILVPQVNFITNNIFLGALGEQQLALAGITGVYYLIFAVLGFGLNSGVQALIARRAGENRIDEIGNLFNQGIRITVVFAALGIFITYAIAPSILRLSLHNETNVQMAVSFLSIRIWGLPFLYQYQMRNALLVGTNQSRFLIIATIAETVINIVLDYVLIYGHFGFPAMGFNGAAVASIAAEITGVVVMLAVMHSRGINKQLQLYKKFTYDAVNTKLILVQSFPIMLQYVLSVCSWEFFYILVEHHGERQLAISNTMRNIFGLFGCASWAFASATNAMVSNVIGQGLYEEVIGLIVKIMKLSTGFALAIFIILNIFAPYLFSIYGQGDEFIRESIPVVRVVSLALIIMSASTVWLNAVIGTGNTRINLFIEIGAIILYCIYAYTVLETLQGSLAAGWMAEWIYWFAMLIPSFIYMKSGIWKGKKI
jgi:putative MATE family efflux protein